MIGNYRQIKKTGGVWGLTSSYHTLTDIMFYDMTPNGINHFLAKDKNGNLWIRDDDEPEANCWLVDQLLTNEKDYPNLISYLN